MEACGGHNLYVVTSQLSDSCSNNLCVPYTHTFDAWCKFLPGYLTASQTQHVWNWTHPFFSLIPIIAPFLFPSLWATPLSHQPSAVITLGLSRDGSIMNCMTMGKSLISLCLDSLSREWESPHWAVWGSREISIFLFLSPPPPPLSPSSSLPHPPSYFLSSFLLLSLSLFSLFTLSFILSLSARCLVHTVSSARHY